MNDYIIEYQLLTDSLDNNLLSYMGYYKGKLSKDIFITKQDNKEIKININEMITEKSEDGSETYNYIYQLVNLKQIKKYYNTSDSEEAISLFAEQLESAVSYFDEKGCIRNLLLNSQGSNKNKKTEENSVILPEFIELENNLNEYIIGQELAIRKILTKVYSHYKNDKKSTILLHGQTGVGKSEIIKQISKKLGVPFIEVDLNNYSATGFKGGDIEDIPLYILKNANFDINLAEKTLVSFDEVDKILMNGGTGSNSEINKGDVVNAILKFIEGHEYNIIVPPETVLAYDIEPIVKLNTNNLCCIFSGAFTAIRNDHFNKKSLGFLNNDKELEKQDLNLDILKKSNISEEFLGRMKAIIPLRTLTKEDYIKILKESQISPFIYFIKLFESMGKELYISDEIYDYIALEASKDTLGARSLTRITEELFEDIEYLYHTNNIPSEMNLSLNIVNNGVKDVFLIEPRKTRKRKINEYK